MYSGINTQEFALTSKNTSIPSLHIEPTIKVGSDQQWIQKYQPLISMDTQCDGRSPQVYATRQDSSSKWHDVIPRKEPAFSSLDFSLVPTRWNAKTPTGRQPSLALRLPDLDGTHKLTGDHTLVQMAEPTSTRRSV